MFSLWLHTPKNIQENPLSLEEHPIPRPSAKQVRIKINYCGVCHTDLHIVEGEIQPPHLPVTPGHQVVGIIDAVGEKVTTLKKGQRAGVPWLYAACGECNYCQKGDENLCEKAEFTGFDVDGGKSVDVSNIEIHGGSVGVDFSFAQECHPELFLNNAIVRNNKITELSPGPVGIGIFVQCSGSAQIIDNEISQVLIGIAGDAPYLGAVSGLVVEGNIVRDGHKGIVFFGVRDSSISNNEVEDYSFGIMMDESYGCLVEDPYWKCHYSTANVISDNVALENGIDLLHHELSTGNTWGENTCETKEGIEIPECN